MQPIKQTKQQTGDAGDPALHGKKKPNPKTAAKIQHDSSSDSKGITAKKNKDMPEWYAQVCQKAEIADYSTVKGCMVIRPNGYAIWEYIQQFFNEHIVKPTGARNAYFPLFIPESFFKKEAEHAEGFKPEVAWIEKDVTGEGERLALRPTSETIMYDSYSKWIRSYRDLPLRINQWCNVVRWETKATKLFLRSREFLWQEGHCVYETKEECDSETENYIRLYAKLCNELLALPVLVGRKTDKEKFAGAEYTLAIEAFMPDGKGLQCGTSHMLGQGFAKAFSIGFLGRDEKLNIPWQNSWGLSTRLIGAIIMAHGDDKGLVLPPLVAYNKIVIVPILIGDSKSDVLKKAKELRDSLREYNPIFDDREEYTPGWKFNEWEMKGIPLRIEIGPKDIAKGQVVLVRRDNNTKQAVPVSDLKKEVDNTLKDMQHSIHETAKRFLESSIKKTDSWQDFVSVIEKRQIAFSPFCGEPDCEDCIKEETGGASSRCIPFEQEKVSGKCIRGGCVNKAKFWAYFAKSY